MNPADHTPEQAPRVPAMLSSAELMQRLIDAGQAMRAVKAELVQLANEAAYRSRSSLPKAENLAAQNGHATAVRLVEFLTRLSSPEARRLVSVGAKTQPRQLLGQVLEPEFPFVGRELDAGQIEPDTALMITGMLHTCAQNGVMPEKLRIAEEALAVEAGHSSVDLVKVQVKVWQAYLDPDGLEPQEKRAFQKRSLRFGKTENGLTEIFLLAPTIDVARIKAAFTEADKLTSQPRFLSEEEAAAQSAAPEIVTGPHGEQYTKFRDPRTPAQHHYDLMLGYFSAGLRAHETGASGARSLATVSVMITAKDLETGVGVGWVEGIRDGISVAEVRRLIDSNGAHPIFFGKNGEIAAYGNRQRGFTEKQRKAIAARDGDSCICGCGMPASALDAHHIRPYSDGGLTEVDNGILVCPQFHRWLVDSGFKFRMITGRPHQLAPPHLDPSQTWRLMGVSRTEKREALSGFDWR